MQALRVTIASLVLALAASVALDAARAAQAAPVSELAKKKKKKKKKKPVLSTADGDALPAAWETKPAAKKKKKKKKKRGKKSVAAPPELWKYGASPHHKDIFVELDYNGAAVRDSIACGELDALHNAFATAPVANPDGKLGINLHMDAGKSCPSRSYDLGGSQLFNAGNCPTLSAVFNASGQLDHPGRLGVFHYAAVVDGCGNTHGAAAQPGVTMAVFTSGAGFGHVFMHELGHNLGLGHEFTDAIGIQPNRLSVMSNQLQLADSPFGPFTQIPDFQRFPVPALDENAMLETTGLQTAAAHRYVVNWKCPEGTPTNPGPGVSVENSWPGDANVDWNCSTAGVVIPGGEDIQNSPVPADINADNDTTDVFPAVAPEWEGLIYDGGGPIGKLPF